jgi:hypothetical protein
VEALGPGDENQGRKCDACGRTNHPASYQIQFGGKAYNKQTLEEIDNDHDDEEDEDDGEEDDASVNSRGESIPGVKTSWYVGRYGPIVSLSNVQICHRHFLPPLPSYFHTHGIYPLHLPLNKLTIICLCRFCKGNAETAHRLKHWKYALNEWVIGTLKSEGHLTPHKLTQREDWNKKKRSEYANRIVDDWWENKEIKALYRDFKNNLEAAREGKTGRWRNQ